MKKDPIQLQCLAEQMHAITSTITEVAEHNNSIDGDSDLLLVIYRAQHFTHWLKETCFDIHKITPSQSTVNDILTALQRVEALTQLCLWQQQEDLNNHIENALAEIANMASECQTETTRLWGQS